jgi:drug/metabolite transporter (DMT)-like permease
MSSLLVGQLAGLATAICWSFTGIFFTLGARRVGAQAVNLARLLLALLVMLMLHRILLGTWLPLSAEPARWGWLALSGVIGLSLGDFALFQSMLFIGPRRAALMMALVPIISTALAWLMFGERLRWVDLLAIALTVAGIAWVVLERNVGDMIGDSRRLRWGLLFGLAAATGQSAGLILSRQGMEGGFSVVSAQLIRILVACAAVWLAALYGRHAEGVVRSLRADRKASMAIVGGTIAGPVVGVMLSLVAITRAPVGIASTLMSLTPITIIPLVYFVFRERISARSLGGTLLALAGVAIIFLL